MTVKKMFNPKKYGFVQRNKSEIWYLDCGKPIEHKGKKHPELSFVYEDGRIYLYNTLEPHEQKEKVWLDTTFDLPQGIIDLIKDGVI